MGHIVDTVADRIQNAILAAIDSFFTPKIDLAIRSNKRILWMGCDQCYGKFRTWGKHRDHCPF